MMIWGAISSFIMMSAIAYAVWALSMKDDSSTKKLGQVLAVLVVVVAIVALVISLTGWGRRPMMKGQWMEKVQQTQPTLHKKTVK